ncbi:MAG TPA: bifunctional DNA-formamidopyrimidine glycosylase/DNA-(apurinic or apyrimidinic site) lyase [Candidatus Acidoferrales bacterium]|nr:bifunctional DNA-formamidopyrimidine glycosylase/DNA-(apurinic or apyrimidinic site) lyase [Candidatus Acidoferrales bacterium]
MPELPEVETVVRGLQAHLPGRSITGLRLGKTDFIDDPAALEQILPGSRILAVHRHGKFIVVHLEKPPTHQTPAESSSMRFDFIVHLGMTGNLVVRPAGAPFPPHTHAWISLDNGTELRYTDPRRFGRMLVLPQNDSAQILGPLGLDPLEATEEQFRTQLRTRRARIKAVLLDQRAFRGMGNIYTDESLWRARIHPARIAANLTREEMARLYRAAQTILREAIRLGGSSISDYVNADGEPGEFQIRHRVYGREGKKCSRCGARIRRIVVAGRSSYFCPRCQRAPRRKKNSELRQEKK